MNHLVLDWIHFNHTFYEQTDIVCPELIYAFGHQGFDPHSRNLFN